MSLEENKDLVRRYVLAHDASDPRQALKFVSPGFVLHLTGMPDLDADGYVQLFGAYKAAFPDMHHTIEEQVAEGDRVVTRATVRATHRGEFQGLPATGKPVTVSLVAINRIENGRVAEDWSIMDSLGILQQLGMLPAAQPA